MVKKEPSKGRQTSAKSIILPYTEIRGQETVDLYTASGRTRPGVAGASDL